MTDEVKLASLKGRLAILKGRGMKNINSPGVINKVQRQIVALERKIAKQQH